MTHLRLARRLGSVLAAGVLAAGCAWLVLDGARSGGSDAGDAPPGVLARADVGPVPTVAGTPGSVAPATRAPAADQPRGLGDDPALDDLWHRCQEGSGAACDQLFQQAPVGSDYESFGVSCGNRPDVLHCTAEMDEPPTTAPPPTFPPPPGSTATR